jgi:hypothetical protein
MIKKHNNEKNVSDIYNNGYYRYNNGVMYCNLWSLDPLIDNKGICQARRRFA